MTGLPEAVQLIEVGPRDGLQNESTVVPSERKAEFVRLLADAGLKEIEVTAFVSPKWVPQLADAGALVPILQSFPGVSYSALVPNMKGLDRALEAGIRRIAVFTAVSETFNKKNINMTVAESIASYREVVRRALDSGVSVRGYLSTCFACPYEGWIARERVGEVTAALFDLGVDEVSIGDTIGRAAPKDVEATGEHLLSRFPAASLAMHFHDTYGMAVANVVQAFRLGFARFDSSAGGLGGCPYAPGAAGNAATEDLVYLFDRLGIPTGVSLDGVRAASRMMQSALGRSLPSRVFQALDAGRAKA